METLEVQRIVVTGGGRGLGLAMVEAFVARKARVTVVARDAERLAEVGNRLGVDVVRGDAADPALARNVIREVKPSVLVLNAGARPSLGPRWAPRRLELLHELRRR
jgi:NAD(P)-dependent dehydrogenase (short-subunit alcohol dehydrogenase family)